MNMNINININELFTLNSLFSSNTNYRKISEYFKKKNYRSSKDKYREGSKGYNDALLEDDKIANIPDYNVKEIGVLTINNDYYKKMRYYIFTITEEVYFEYRYDSYSDFDSDSENKSNFVTYNFLIENPYHVYDIITNLSGLLKCSEIQELLFDAQLRLLQQNVDTRLETMPIEFSILRETIIDAIKNLNEVSYYTSYYNNSGYTVTITDLNKNITIYNNVDISIIYNDFKNNKKFYDSNDKLIENYYSDYVKFWNIHNNNNNNNK